MQYALRRYYSYRNLVRSLTDESRAADSRARTSDVRPAHRIHGHEDRDERRG